MVVEGEAVVLAVAVVGDFVVVIGAAVAVKSVEEDASAAGYMSMGMVSWSKDTSMACHSHYRMAAEHQGYCTVPAGEFVHADTAAGVDNAGIDRDQVVGSSSPRETDDTRINRVWSRTRGMVSAGVEPRVGPDKLQGGQLISFGCVALRLY